MRWRRGTRTAVIAFGFVVFGLATAAAQGRVSGRITDAASNRPLAGVQVFIPATGIGNLTDADGRYLLQNVPVGQQRVTAQLVGYKQGEVMANVTAGQTALANLAL